MDEPLTLITAGLAAGSIRHTPMDVPPMLLAGVGYDGEARYVSLYWIPGGDELLVDDGRVAFTGRWHAYVTWSHHPYVRWQTPVAFNFGASDMLNTHRWLIDREAGIIYAGLDAPIRQVVRAQWPPAPPVVLTSDDWEEITATVVNQFREILGPPPGAIMESMEAEARLSRLLTTWLDERYATLVQKQNSAVPLAHNDLLGPEDAGDQAAADAAKRRN